MEEFNEKCLNALIEEGKKVLEKNNSPFKPLYLTLHKSIYDNWPPEEWTEYLKRQNNLVVTFIDEDETYRLTITGELEILDE